LKAEYEVVCHVWGYVNSLGQGSGGRFLTALIYVGLGLGSGTFFATLSFTVGSSFGWSSSTIEYNLYGNFN